MELMINGEPRRLRDGLTAVQLLEGLSVKPEGVVVEVNLTIVKRAQLPTTVLKDGDRVEIVRLVGGGSGLDSRLMTQDASQSLGSWVLGLGS